jgi:hypothetical protein
MALLEQLPGYLALAFRQGDDFACTVDFDIDVTGYTWEAQIRSPITGEEVQEITVTASNPSAGVITLGLSELATEALPAGTWGWTLVGTVGGVSRTYFSGFVEVSR